MTRELSSCLTKTSAAYLRAAIGAFNHDSFDRHQPEGSNSLEALQIAFDWQATENETNVSVWLRNDKKRAAHLEEQDAKFRTQVNEILVQHFDDKKSWPESPEWTKHFPGHPTAHGVPPAPYPDEEKLKSGSFEHCMAWSDFNIQRVTQHRITLAICSQLVMDTHSFKHLQEPLARAKSWAWRRAGQLEATRVQLIILEGDPAKIQALREETLNEIRSDRHSVNHFYTHFNDQGAGGTEGDKRFRAEALRHVQSGLDTGAAATNVSYSDLGLG